MGTLYATRADFAQSGLPPLAYEGLDDAAIDSALVSSSEFADSYIGQRFELPLATWSRALTDTVCELAAYRVMCTRGFQPGAPDAEVIEKRRDNALKWLEDVAKGRALPAYPTTKDAQSFNPQQQPQVLVSAPGGIGLSGGTSDACGDFASAGTVGPPRGRGW